MVLWLESGLWSEGKKNVKEGRSNTIVLLLVLRHDVKIAVLMS